MTSDARPRRRVRRGAPGAHRAHRRGARPRPRRGPRRARSASRRVTIRKDLAMLEQQGRAGADPRRRRRRRPGRRRARVRRPRAAPARPRRTRSAARPRRWSSTARASRSTRAPRPWRCARHLKARGGWLHLTVITNGLRIAVGARRASRASPSRCPAGFVRWEALSLVGPLGDGPVRARSTSRRRSWARPGSRIEAGLSDATEEEAQIKRLMVAGRERGRRPRRPHEVGAGGVRDVLPDRRRSTRSSPTPARPPAMVATPSGARRRASALVEPTARPAQRTAQSGPARSAPW